MDALDWRFPAILVGAMLLGLLLTWVQMRSYNAELNRALRAVRGEHLVLVSGRGRSLAGGAIVIAVVDTRARRIIRARALAGRSVFARFHDAPELVGDLTGAVDRATADPQARPPHHQPGCGRHPERVDPERKN